MRSQTFKPKRRKPPFNPDLRESVTHCGEEPLQYRGLVTDTLYVWNARRPVRWVDRRDLPGLVKQGNVDDLDGEWIAEFKSRKAERAKTREEKKRIKESKREVTE